MLTAPQDRRSSRALAALLAAVMAVAFAPTRATAQPGGGEPGGGAVADPLAVERLAGTGRVETAAAVARASWDTADTVVLARADAFPDALAGGPLAAALDAPLLLTGRDGLHPVTAAELDRLDVTDVVLLGGTAALSTAVADDIRALGVQATRLAGPDRYATAAAILADRPMPSEIVLASGTSFPDALAAGGLQPDRVLLTGPDALAPATAAALDGAAVDDVIAVGGTAVVSDAVAEAAAGDGQVTRLAGPERYATAATITAAALDRLPDDPRPLIVTTGQAFPDALTAGPLAARLDAPIVLVPRHGQLPDATTAMLSAHADRFDRIVVLGGEAAVSAETVDWVRAAITGPLPAPDIDPADCGDADFPCGWADADPALADRSAALLDAGLAQLRGGASPADVVADLRAHDDVAGVLHDGAAITFRVSGAPPTVILTAGAAPGLDVAPAEVGAAAASGEGTMSVQSFDPAGPAGDPKDVLVLAPYQEAWATQGARDVAETFAARDEEYGRITVLHGQQVTLDAIRSIPSYDVVTVIGHGASQGFAIGRTPELFEIDPETGETTPSASFGDGFLEGVWFTGDVNDPPGERRPFVSWAFIEDVLYTAGDFDLIFFASWCQSAKISPYALTGFPQVFADSGEAVFLGWTDNVWVDFAGRATSRYWELMVEHGVAADLGHSMLATEGLTTYPPALAAEIDGTCDGDVCKAPPRLTIVPGDDLRARDVIEARVSGQPLTSGADLKWEGEPEDGVEDVLTDLSFLVEGVERGREDEAAFRLFLRGDATPVEEIDVDWSLADDGAVVDSGAAHDDWLVTVDRVDLGYDVPDAMTAPAPLTLEVRVGTDEQYSAQEVADVRLAEGGISAVHPDVLTELRDGDPHPADGTEGDGQPDATTVTLEVDGVDGEDVDRFTVDATIVLAARAEPVRLDAVPLATFTAAGEDLFRRDVAIALDEDLVSDNRDMAIDATLLRDGAVFSTSSVTVELHAASASGCWIERTWDGTFYDDREDQLVPVSGSYRRDVVGQAGATEEGTHLLGMSMGQVFGLEALQIHDETGSIPLQTGTYDVPFDPEGAGGDGEVLQGMVVNIAVGDEGDGDWYLGGGTLTIDEIVHDVIGASTPYVQVELLDGTFSGTLQQADGAGGQVEVSGQLHFTRDGCLGLEQAARGPVRR